MNITLSFLGGAGTETGSKYLLQREQHGLLVDCGNAPYTVLQKIRRRDREVEISVRNLPDLDAWTPVIFDDIGRTMIGAVRLIIAQVATTPVSIAVHGLFADNSDALLAPPAWSRQTASLTTPTVSMWANASRHRSARLHRFLPENFTHKHLVQS